MTEEQSKSRPRGRPKKGHQDSSTRDALIRAGLERLTSEGFYAAGIEPILRQAGVPKGSFYHYFKNKEAFGLAVLEAYDDFFSQRLQRCFSDASLAPLERLRHWHDLARTGMEKYHWQRGCLVGNLATESQLISQFFASKVDAVWGHWKVQLAELLKEAQQQGDIQKRHDCDALADFFWTGWEGAVLRARLQRQGSPLTNFLEHFLQHCQH